MPQRIKKSFSIVLAGSVATVFIILFGYFLTTIFEEYGIRNETKDLLSRTITAAASFNPSVVASLKGKPSSITNPEFQLVRSQLFRIKNASSDARFLYLMAKEYENIVFLADAESQISEDYSAPGDIYENPSPELIDIFRNAKPFVEGPIEDNWGVWVSGIAPIIDSQRNQVIAIIGIDVDAVEWQKNIRPYKWFSYAITGLVGVIIVVFFAAIYALQSKNIDLQSEMKEREKLEETLEKSEAHYRDFIEKSSDMIQNVAPDGHILFANNTWKKALGYNDEELQGLTIEDIIDSRHLEQCMQMFSEVINGKTLENVETAFVAKNGEVIQVLGSVNCKFVEEQPVYTRAFFHDITQRKMLEKKLEILSTTDQLTESYNRRAFEDIFAKEVQRALRYNTPLSLVFFDIDHFKKVNDTLGHDVGDQVLKKVVKIAKQQIRDVDFLVRWGGEEFLILLPGISLKGGAIVAERLREAVEKSNFATSWQLTVSLGVSQFQSKDTCETLLKRADHLQYEAKQGGRNRVVVQNITS